MRKRKRSKAYYRNKVLIETLIIIFVGVGAVEINLGQLMIQTGSILLGKIMIFLGFFITFIFIMDYFKSWYKSFN